MKALYTPLLILLASALISCKEDKADDPAPKPNPVAEKLFGLWERSESKWQYYDEAGAEKQGLPWAYSHIKSYGFTSYGNVRVNYVDGSGGPTTYELTEKDGADFIELPDGYGLGTKTDYLIQTLTDSTMVLVATYNDTEYTDTDTNKKEQASEVVNTVTLLKQ